MSVYDLDQRAIAEVRREHIQRDSFKHVHGIASAPEQCPRCVVVALLAALSERELATDVPSANNPGDAASSAQGRRLPASSQTSRSDSAEDSP